MISLVYKGNQFILISILLTIKIFACFPDSSRASINFNKANVQFNEKAVVEIGLKYDVKISIYKNNISFYSLSKRDIISSYKVYKNQNTTLDRSSSIDKAKVVKILDLAYQKGYIKNFNKQDLESIKQSIGSGLTLFYLSNGCKVDKKMYNKMLYNGKYLYTKDIKKINQQDIQDKWYAFTNDYQIIYSDNCPKIVK